VDYNPLTAKLRTAEKKIKDLERRRAAAAAQLAWAKRFKPEAATTEITRLQADLKGRIAELRSLEAESSRLEATSRLLNSKTSSLEDKARMGWNPGYWFSDKRSDAKERLKKHQQEVDRHLQRVHDADRERNQVASAVKRLTGMITRREVELARFKSFQSATVQKEIEQIDGELPLRGMERDDVKAHKADVDGRLKAPMAELRKYESEMEGLLATISGLRSEQSKVRDQINEAERIDNEISRASNSYERAMLHRKCEERFGAGSPSRVIRGLQFQMRQYESTIEYNKRQIARIRRDFGKTEERIKRIAEVASRDIRALMIDGKNCCFEGNQFIGLAALIPLTKELAKRYDVTVVFDASIRRDLGTSDDDLRAALSGARVHVVASGAKADETILDAAADPAIWVISNDRFGDYRDKTPVKERRVIRHEILHGRVMVHDLSVEARFAGGM
jgi:hypothetical protein